MDAKVARPDSLPEHKVYLDTGCDLHANCLTCPFERCRYDEPSPGRGLAVKTRLMEQELAGLRRQGLTMDEIAQRWGVARRTAYRVLAKQRAKA
ncbi:MAG: hypothetical protein A3E01_15170 [Gammaproteobacteria bacterium RIFCSPHIGHO2_12_FULL_63_22]|nr:MAG: hypothetical protein A3E01_15170 [Gammaproteobacteria bacterium RIFCSPHIGHO2_12_FULL_63_22]